MPTSRRQSEPVEPVKSVEPVEPADPDADAAEVRPCPYLPDRTLRLTGGGWPDGEPLAPDLHERLIGANHRRSGHVIYRPACPGCQACRSLRVLADRFRPTRSMRRVRRRNADVDVTVAAPQATPEKHDIFRRYLRDQHDRSMPDDLDTFLSFLYVSPTDTIEVTYRLAGRIVAVGILDQLAHGLSSVYTYFDPRDRRRGLGIYSALWEIGYCARLGLPYYYFGYYVAGSPKMEYKARFRPNEITEPLGVWVPFRT